MLLLHLNPVLHDFASIGLDHFPCEFRSGCVYEPLHLYLITQQSLPYYAALLTQMSRRGLLALTHCYLDLNIGGRVSEAIPSGIPRQDAPHAS
jgi:hypothetical protein